MVENLYINLREVKVNKRLCVFSISILLVLAGCGDRADTSSGSGAEIPSEENTITTDSGGLIEVVHDDEAAVNSIIRLRYVVRDSVGEDQSGTLFWDDNSSSRVRGSGLINHIYRAPGTYRIAIQPDGEEKLVVGAITVLPSANCRPLVIPSFTSVTGFPGSTPNPFRIEKVGDCNEFVSANGSGAAQAQFTTSSLSNASEIRLRGAPTSSGEDIFLRCEIIIIPSVGGIVIPPIRRCRVPAVSGESLASSGMVTFPTAGNLRCMGFVDFTGDTSTLLVTSNEIRINCQ